MAGPRVKLPSNHSLRNPLRPIQLSRRREGLSAATRAGKNLKRVQNKSARLALESDCDDFAELRDQEIVRLAALHHVKEDKVRKLLTNASTVKRGRAMTLRNAIMHDLSRKSKADPTESGPVVLADLQDRLSDRVESGELCVNRDLIPEAEIKRLFDQLAEHRARKRRGVRATNKAAAMDGQQVADAIGAMMLDLYERTGIRGFCAFSRGNPDDAGLPYAVDSDDVLKSFLLRALNMSEFDFLRTFENHCCIMDNGHENKKTDTASVRSDLVRYQVGGLRNLLGNKKVAMAYENYEYEIRRGRAVEIANWPEGVDMVRPSKLSVPVAREIRDGFRDGTIYWRRLSKAEHTELLEGDGDEEEEEEEEDWDDEDEPREKGKGRGKGKGKGNAKKPRKERSDKGSKRTAKATSTPSASASTCSAPASTSANASASTAAPASNSAAAPASAFAAFAPFSSAASAFFPTSTFTPPNLHLSNADDALYPAVSALRLPWDMEFDFENLSPPSQLSGMSELAVQNAMQFLGVNNAPAVGGPCFPPFDSSFTFANPTASPAQGDIGLNTGTGAAPAPAGAGGFTSIFAVATNAARPQGADDAAASTSKKRKTPHDAADVASGNTSVPGTAAVSSGPPAVKKPRKQRSDAGMKKRKNPGGTPPSSPPPRVRKKRSDAGKKRGVRAAVFAQFVYRVLQDQRNSDLQGCSGNWIEGFYDPVGNPQIKEIVNRIDNIKNLVFADTFINGAKKYSVGHQYKQVGTTGLET
ncbi:hypothetical protein DFH09DRAFT_1424420 [Mycena vulgaris]|nr:hypothetical protein DFH09DRAFT_1476096 [Mycena vulgaris]KAJ6521764.1 hypothetical protein DFH09DRAFT_1424420 [Mycena vulgaris]